MIESLNYLREPLWLWLSLLPGLFLLVSFLLRHYRTNHYADAKLKNWVTTSRRTEQQHRFRQIILIQLSWVAFAIALAGPRLPEKIHDDSHEYYQEVMLVLDLSLSMSARDSLPSRIERAKLEAFDLISRMQNVRLGVVVYAAKPHLLTPFTYDKSVLRHYIKPLRTQLLPTEGSQIIDALSFAIKQFSDNRQLPRSIVLISDGEANQAAQQHTLQLESLSEQLKENKVQLYTLGVGTQQGAALLSNHTGWLENNNQAVISRLNRSSLIQLANIGNGVYSDVRDDDDDWSLIYDKGIALKHFESSKQKIDDLILWHEYFSEYLLLGILFLFLSLYPFSLIPINIINRSKSEPSKNSQLAPAQLKGTLSLLLSLLLIIFMSGTQSKPAFAVDSDTLYKTAYQQLQDSEWQQAKDNFAKIPGYRARFAEGAATYQLKQYKLAIPIFIQATLDANTDQQRIDAVFNLANCYYKLEQYQHAESLYQDVLRYQPTHHAALVNLSYTRELFAEKKIDEKAIAKRAGTGPRMEDAPDNMDISNSKVSLGDAQSKSQAIIPDANNQTKSKQMITGLEASTPASMSIEATDDDSWTYDINDLSVLQQKSPRIHTDEAILWQRLFEVEESFEAAQEKPNVLPGVKPW